MQSLFANNKRNLDFPPPSSAMAILQSAQLPLDISARVVYSYNDFRYRKSILMPLTTMSSPTDQDLLTGLIRIHILYHACKDSIFGLAMIEELQRHGYKLSPGTMYPMLHGLERKGLLQSQIIQSGKRRRRVYRATTAGREAMRRAREKVKVLLGELLE